MKQNYDEIRPYNDAEIPAAAQRVADSPYLPAIVNYLFPGKKVEEIQQLFRNFRSVYDFQITIMYPAIRSIIEKTSNGLTTAASKHSRMDENGCSSPTTATSCWMPPSCKRFFSTMVLKPLKSPLAAI